MDVIIVIINIIIITIIIIINNLFIVGSNSIIKANKNQVTKKIFQIPILNRIHVAYLEGTQNTVKFLRKSFLRK